MSPIVIVGSGLAGYALVRELRKLDPELPLTLVTADSGDVYSKPMLSNALAQGHAPRALVQTPAGEQAEKLDLRLLAGCTVSAIHPAARLLDTSQGPLPYGKLVLALGALPRVADFPGGDQALSVNHLNDYTRFRDRLKPGARVAILGGGLVGCEFANDLALAGHPVEVIEVGPRPLARQAPAAISQRLQERLSALGVVWHCGRRVMDLTSEMDGYRLELDDGRTVLTHLVLSAIGLTPAIELARSAGLATARGILVDTRLTSSDAHIHALGDCAEVLTDTGGSQAGLLLPYVLPLMQQARTLAALLVGQTMHLTLPALPVAVKTPACPLVVCPPPDHAQGDWHAEREDEQGAIHHFLGQDGQFLGFALAGDACGQRRNLAGKAPPLLP